MRVLAAMSGGVDSAVAAARAVAAGHDVTAVHMALSADPALTRDGARGCCTISDAHDARRAADILGIPFYVWDMAEEFRRTVVADFVAEYEAGRTPNPCIRCNQHIKFAALLERALALGFDSVATGHYARLEQCADGPVLRRARDHGKDQSYVLAVLRPDQLRHCLFPLGDSLKTEVRDEAAAWGLLIAQKPDSHDICFIPDGDTAGFLREQLGERPGVIVDADTGIQIGAHSGTYGFTVGQRKGLGVTDAPRSGRPRYVLTIEPVTRTVVVGDRADLAATTLAACDAVWCAPIPRPGAPLAVQIRAHGDPVDCVVIGAEPFGFDIESVTPLIGVAAGQSAVLYDGDQVVGQGTIRVAPLPVST
ncbi:MAG: tRNA 2-thiouridine(34) synthase MnmA [Candidatus Nanopelagicales bacterium]